MLPYMRLTDAESVTYPLSCGAEGRDSRLHLPGFKVCPATYHCVTLSKVN